MQNKKIQSASKKQNGDLANNIAVYQILRFNEDTQAYKTLSVELSEKNKVMLRLTTGISGDKKSRQNIMITLTLSELTEISEICKVLYNHIKLQEISNLLSKRDANIQKQKSITNNYEENDEEEDIKPKKQNIKPVKSKHQYDEYEEDDDETYTKKKQKFNKASKIQSEYNDEEEDIGDEYEDEE